MGDENDGSREIRELIRRYRFAKETNQPCYLDTDEFADMAEYYLNNDQVKETLEVVEDGLAIHPDSEYLLSLKINALISLHRFEEGRQLLVKIDPEEDQDVYYFQAQLACGSDRDYKKMNQWFDKWIECEAKDCRSMDDEKEGNQRLREAYMHILLSIFDLAEADEAPRLMEPWVDRYVKHCSPVPGDDIDLDIARVCHDASMTQKEIELYTLFLDSNPYLPQGWTYLSVLQIMVGDMENAVNSAEFALAIDPDDWQAQMVKGYGYGMMENYQESSKALRHYVRITGDESYSPLLAESLMKAGMRDEAYEVLQHLESRVTKFVKDKRERAEVRSQMADTYVLGGFYKEALKCINAALRSYPDDSSFKVQKGDTFLWMNKLEDAMECFRQAALPPNNTFNVIMSIGISFLSHQYAMSAAAYLELAAKYPEEPRHDRLNMFLAQCYFQLGKYEEFYDRLEKACRLTPDLVASFYHKYLIGIAPEDYFNTLKRVFGTLR